MATTQPGTPPEEGEKAIIFGLHWLEMGGAEKWALETIALARSAGFLPIVLTDRESSHPWITRPELDGALVIPMNPPMSDDEETAFLLGLLEKFSVRGIHVHHNGWLYHRLPWFKAMNPAIHTVDSLHVVEWRTGGFVELAVKLSNAIDTHHVISPQLRDYMVLQRDVPKNRVELAPLYGLSSSEPVLNIEKDSERPFTISFIGRLSQQKRPYLFLRYAAALKRSVNQEVRFILHGTGALADETSRLIAKYGLTAHLDWRQPPRSVDETLAQSDLLVISSDNEGLTLTTFEATAHDVAVLSTDVGSQASLVSGEALVPRQTLTFLKEAVERTKAIIASEDLRNRIVEEQRQKIAALRELPEARDWTAKLYEGWKA
ncbi:glycosyltransferase [Pseudarthrobacter phenanthrenivorans]|nr:glycosyltransferase [Pseudarthrobacter phenanthrenivorans]